jgi:hypothetical protein
MSTRKEPPYFSLLSAGAFGYGAYLLGRRIVSPQVEQTLGINIVFGIGLLSCLLMAAFLLVGFWRSIR